MQTYALYNEKFFKEKPSWMPRKLFVVVCQRSNPRNLVYMMNLLKREFPEAVLCDFKNIPLSAKDVILLYPDSIGLGWSRIEKECFNKFQNVTVLNGRGRTFQLNHSTHAKLIFRRFLEMTFLPELLFAPFLLLIGITLSVTDKMRGRS